MSHGHAVQVLEQLEHEVTVLTAKAEQADKSAEPECSVSLPEEIARRQERRKSIAQAVAIIEQRHQQGHEEQMRQYQAKKVAREEKLASGIVKPISGHALN